MKPENYLMSEEKWNDKDGIVAELMKPGVDWYDELDRLLRKKCGHCKEYQGKSNYHCNPCSLDKEKLCGEEGFFYLVDMCNGEVKLDKPKALRIAKRIYKAILKDDPREEV